MRIRTALAWTIGLVAAVVGLGHGAPSAPQPSAAQRSHTVAVGLTHHTSRGAIVDPGSPAVTAGPTKTSAKHNHWQLTGGLVASSTALDRPAGALAVQSAAQREPVGAATTLPPVRAPPGAPRA